MNTVSVGMKKTTLKKVGPIKRIAFVFFAAVFGLLALEIAARFVRTIVPEQFTLKNELESELALEPDPELLWKLTPGEGQKFDALVRVNSLGMRGAELTNPKPVDHFRILFLGDSSVFGHGVPESGAFPWLIKQILDTKSGQKIEIANAAVPGYSSMQCRILFERLKDSIKPDAVVLAPIWSDMMILKWKDKESLGNSGGISHRTQRILNKSAAAQFVFQLVLASKGIKDKRRLVLNSIFRYMPDSSPDSTRRVEPAEHRQNLSGIVTAAKESGIEVLLMVLPGKDDPNNPQSDVVKYRDNYKTVAGKNKVPLLNLPAIFSDIRSRSDADLFIDDVHPNHKGHRVIAQNAAEIIATWFEK